MDDVILAVDPGPTESAWVFYNTRTRHLEEFGYDPVVDVRRIVEQAGREPSIPLAIEVVACYGMKVGQSIFDTCEEVGRLITLHGGPIHRIKRKEVVRHLTGGVTGGDAAVRAAILARFLPSGGGKTPQVGTKAAPGPLYGVKGDIWAALGVAITAAEAIG